MTADLKPCPFCGSKAKDQKGFVCCLNEGCYSDIFFLTEEWENAWCHKRISELEKANVVLSKNALDRSFKILELEKELKRMGSTS